MFVRNCKKKLVKWSYGCAEHSLNNLGRFQEQKLVIAIFEVLELHTSLFSAFHVDSIGRFT